jgi:DMSO/TMAO reductase YedYZ molybdopterin-dependent catalytic subunit
MGLVSDDPKYQKGEPPQPVGLPENIIISPDTFRENRIPPGQTRTRKWPVLHASYVPEIPLDQWRLTFQGLINNPVSLSWEDFQKLPRIKVFADFHCVTTWSRLGNVWEGVSTKEIAKLIGIKPEVNFALPMAYDSGWTTNMPIINFLQEDALFADIHDGMPIDADHGGPLRLIVPQLYAWKSAKWISGVEFSATDKPGYWEQAGYHNQGDPWTEERFGPSGIPSGYYE